MDLNIRAVLVAAVPSLGINHQFADRPFSALLIDGGYHAIQFVLYGVVPSPWH